MTQETRKFDAEIAKVLNLVIHSLYTNKDIFLRELISNASDACDKLRFEAQSNTGLLGEEPLKISIKTDAKARTLTISDNGIGMNKTDLVENLGTIAKSGTQSFLQQLSGDKKQDVNLIGQFGVGFYSSFMVASKVVVKSLKAGETQGYEWESAGEGEYTIREASDIARGTEITLFMREDEDKYLDKHKIGHIVQTYSDHITIPIEFTDEEGKANKLNKGTALWLRSKSEVTEDQYQEFYRNFAHQIDKPFMILHNKAEGKIEYTNLLFIPSIKPFDLYHPDRLRRVKLYVKRVFIAEENIEVIPRYLRFIRGVVDSEDLPLNISRETLQANPLVDKIRKSITSKVLSELKKKAEKEPAEYEKFWNNYGPVIKEGLCEVLDTKEEILEICRFQSTSGEGLTSIDEYISRMKPDQNEIYYLSGDSIEGLRNSPQIEGFAKRGIEVLFFTDTVDDFWVNTAYDYKGKQFKSVTRSDIDLDSGSSTENPDKKEETKEESALVEIFKKELGEKVKDVKYSNRLTESPVCLTVGEGDMDIRMERFLREQKQLPYGSAKILEINPDHKLIKSLSEKGETQEVRDTINLLFEQALIMEGENIPDLKGFSSRLNQFLEKALAA